MLVYPNALKHNDGDEGQEEELKPQQKAENVFVVVDDQMKKAQQQANNEAYKKEVEQHTLIHAQWEPYLCQQQGYHHGISDINSPVEPYLLARSGREPLAQPTRQPRHYEQCPQQRMNEPHEQQARKDGRSIGNTKQPALVGT